MTKLLIDSTTLSGIADQIRYKEESSSPIQVSDYAQRIHDLPAGGISQVESVTINNKAALSNITVSTTGYTDYLLDVTVLPADAPQMTQVVLSNPSVAVVKDNGDGTHSLRVIDGGTTTVTVSDYSGTITDSFTMTVSVPLLSFAFVNSSVDVPTGGTRQLELTFKPANATNKNVTWSSNSQDVTVDQNGLVTASATAAADAIITATSQALGTSITATVSPKSYVDNPDWAAIQAAVANGEHPYNIGSELTLNWKQYTSASAYTQRQLTFIVAHYGTVEDENGNQKPGMYLHTKELTPVTLYFENEQRVEATETNAQDGVYYYGYNGSTYTALNLELGDPVPYGMWTKVYKSGIDFSKSVTQITQAGLNWWKDSSVRQWLNSESSAQGFGWQAQHITDTNSNSAMYGGFLRGCDADFLAVLKPVKVTTNRNTVIWNGETDTTYDRIFLPSSEQVGTGAVGTAGSEGTVWDYYSTGGNTARTKKPVGQTSANYWWLRSAYQTYSNYEYGIRNSGARNNYIAYNNYYVAPACVIF